MYLLSMNRLQTGHPYALYVCNHSICLSKSRFAPENCLKTGLLVPMKTTIVYCARYSPLNIRSARYMHIYF